jgi:hypothetical protein
MNVGVRFRPKAFDDDVLAILTIVRPDEYIARAFDVVKRPVLFLMSCSIVSRGRGNFENQ